MAMAAAAAPQPKVLPISAEEYQKIAGAQFQQIDSVFNALFIDPNQMADKKGLEQIKLDLFLLFWRLYNESLVGPIHTAFKASLALPAESKAQQQESKEQQFLNVSSQKLYEAFNTLLCSVKREIDKRKIYEYIYLLFGSIYRLPQEHKAAEEPNYKPNPTLQCWEKINFSTNPMLSQNILDYVKMELPKIEQECKAEYDKRIKNLKESADKISSPWPLCCYDSEEKLIYQEIQKAPDLTSRIEKIQKYDLHNPQFDQMLLNLYCVVNDLIVAQDLQTNLKRGLASVAANPQPRAGAATVQPESSGAQQPQVGGLFARPSADRNLRRAALQNAAAAAAAASGRISPASR